jgi:hypothetical protein
MDEAGRDRLLLLAQLRDREEHLVWLLLPSDRRGVSDLAKDGLVEVIGRVFKKVRITESGLKTVACHFG